jgi:redox-sensitive bicupin YhaK (pirin superfamily)
MMKFRCSGERGYADHGWLKSHHSFSFADYHDPAHMGWGNLRVINEDRIASGKGFGTHGHRDMEIVSVVLDGALAHEDSMGNGTTILPGEVQRMTAGTGVRHSEFNHAGQTTHFLQIWLLPERGDLAPSYEQRAFPLETRRGRLTLVGSPQAGAGDALHLNADARLWLGHFEGDDQARLVLDPLRKAYVHLARGTLVVNGQALRAGDALALENEAALELRDGHAADVLVFDLAP